MILCVFCGCVLGPTLDISWIDLALLIARSLYLNKKKKKKLRSLNVGRPVLLGHRANVADTFSWIVTHIDDALGTTFKFGMTYFMCGYICNPLLHICVSTLVYANIIPIIVLVLGWFGILK